MKFQEKMEMNRIKDIYARLKSNDAREWSCLNSLEITAADIATIREFMAFYPLLFARKHLGSWPVITRDQASRFLHYLEFFNVDHRNIDHGIEVLYRDEHGYEARPDKMAFYIDDTFTCKQCGKAVPPFESTCAGCIEKKVKLDFNDWRTARNI